MLHRISLLMAAIVTALAVAAAPALADGDDDDDGDGGVAQSAPRGGVQTGSGGTATHGPNDLLAGVAAGGLAVIATAGGLVLRRRETP